MGRIPRVVAVRWLGQRVVRVEFDDGLVREVDFAGQLDSGVFRTIDNDEAFAAVFVDGSTLAWPGDVDIDPAVLHGDLLSADGWRPRVVREYRVERTR